MSTSPKNANVDKFSAYESKVREWALMLTQALNYLHGLGIIVRNLCADSIMFTSVRPDAHPRIVKLNRAALLAPDERTLGQFGDPVFQAPEVRSGKPYTFKADSYSLGVIIYFMLFNDLPPTDIKDDVTGHLIEMFQNNQENGMYSVHCQQVLVKLLDTNDITRLSIPALLRHEWFGKTANIN